MRSRISWWVSASKGAANATRNARRASSCPVAGIDANIALSEIAGPEPRPALALAANLEMNGAIGLVELLLECIFGETRGQATAAHQNVLHFDINFRRIEGHAGISGRGEDTPPVGIAARDGCLDERRVGDGARQCGGCIVIGGACDVDSDELLRALAIASNLTGKRFH